MSLALLCLPAFLYMVFLWHRRTAGGVRERWAGAAAGAATFVAMLAVLAMMNHPGPWTDRTQIAWVGIEPSDEVPLVMGGNVQDAAPGWPLRHANPRVSFTPDGGAAFVVHCGGGGGFVFDDRNHLLYGTPLTATAPAQVGNYKLLVRNYWYAVPWTHARRVIGGTASWHIAVYDSGGHSLLAGNEGVLRASDETVIELLPALDGTIRRMRAHSDPASGPLMEWASHIQLLLRSGDKAYYIADNPNLEPAAPGQRVPAGSELTIHWPHLRLKMRLETDRGIPRLVFLPPFRQSSPLPPADFAHPGHARLTIVSSPSPGDVAFLLPISLLHQQRYEADMEQGLFIQPEKSATIAVPLPEAERPSFENFPGVTSSIDAQIDRYHFYFDTIRDVPAVWLPGREGSGVPLSLPLFLAWLSYLCCVATVCDPAFSLEPRTRLSLLGFSLVVWVALCLRLALAYRYAVNPGTLDELGQRGLLLALAAITALPGFILLLACLTLLVRARTNNAAALRRAWLWSLPALAVIFFLPWITRGIWPGLGGSSGSLGFWPVSTLFLLWACLSMALWIKWRRMQRASWKPSVPMENRLASVRRWVEQRWQAGWPKANILFGFVVSGTICGLALVSNLVRPLNGIGKEVLAPLYQLIAIAIMLAVKPYSLRGERRVTFPRRWLLRAMLILVPFFVLPFCFNDIGGIYAGCSLLIPFGFVLAFRQARRPAWFLAPLASLFIVGLFLLWYFPGQVPGQRSYARLQLWKHTSQWVQSQLLWEQAYTPDSGWGTVKGWIHTHLLGEESWSPGGNSRAQQLADADAHIWANRRMVAIGGFWGTGYGQVRAAKAGIPLQTLQSDSTYAFYIAGEHGAVGGACLLLFAALPVAFAWWRHRQSRQPTWLSDLLYIVAAAFYIETLCQIVMNALPLVPITGRSMPLLSVHSTSDLLRWTALFGCAAVFMVTDRESSVSGSNAPTPRTWHTTLIVLVVIAPGALPSLALMNPPPAIYDRDQRIRDQIEATRERLTYDSRSRLISFRSKQAAELEEYNEIHQEMEHFNRLPDAEKVPLRGEASSSGCGGSRDAATLEDYGDWMQAQMNCDTPSRSPHPPLFRVFAPDDFADEEGLLENTDPDYIIAANPAYDAAVNLDTELKPGKLKAIAWRDGGGASWLLQGMGAQIRIASVAAPGQAQARVRLRLTGRRLLSDTDDAPGVTRFLLGCGVTPIAPRNQPRRKVGRKPGVVPDQKLPSLMDVVADTDKIKILPGDVKLEYQSGGKGWYKSLKGPVELTNDVRVRTRDGVCRLPQHPSFTLSRSSEGSLIGEAWVEGEWVPAYNRTAGIPWLEELAWAMRSKHPPQFRRLTLDRTLQATVQQFVEQRGRELQAKLLAETPRSLPPRVAFSIMTAPSGEVEAMGGWPRNSTSDEWEPVPDADGEHWIDVRPPVRWLTTQAPAAIRSRYLGERNFDRMIVGSASKPVWAAAALAVNPKLAHLDVSGNKVEDSLFGTKIPGRTWTGTASGPTNFADYLAKSNNSYQVTLNFLALAPPGAGNDPVEVQRNQSGRAIQTGDRSVAFDNVLWQRFPDLSKYGFGPDSPNRLDDVQTSALAATMQKYYSLEATDGVLRQHRISFWSGNENDNRALPDGTAAEDDPWSSYVYMSPETTNLALDGIHAPRAYITDLLGGGTNLWSNVDLPSAIYTAAAGTRLVPHIAMLDKPAVSAREAPSAEVTALIREGLKRMVDVGTGRDYLPGHTRKFAEDTRCGCEFYAKTGTLHQDTDRRDVPAEDMARLVLVIVPHDSRPGGARKTLILSLMIEHGGREAGMESNNAVKWMAEFLTDNTPVLQRAMR
jgi:hypothetical protein